MIRVHRGAEPTSLAQEREWRLAELRFLWAEEEVDAGDFEWIAEFVKANSSKLDKGYRVAERELLAQTLYKCAYCEGGVLLAEDIDHFRPRRSKSADGNIVHPGYFWLTWSWDNLFFVCKTCHGPKGNTFEISGERMLPWDEVSGVDASRLIDPSREDPSGLIEFRKDPNGKWVAHGLGDRAAHTVEKFNLGVDKDRYKSHLDELVREINDVIKAAQDGSNDSAEFNRLWRRLIRFRIERKDARFRAFSRAYIAHKMAETIQARDLVLPSLADDSPVPGPVSLFKHRPELNGLDEKFAFSIRALNPKYRTDDAKLRVLTMWAKTGGGALTDLLEKAPDLARDENELDTLKAMIANVAAEAIYSWDGSTLSTPANA